MPGEVEQAVRPASVAAGAPLSQRAMAERFGLSRRKVSQLNTTASLQLKPDDAARGSRTSRTTGPVVRGFDENGEVAFELPVVDAASLAMWCELHLGSPAESELFRAGNLTRVIGTRLDDGREVVVRVRSAAPRLTACTEVQRRLFDSGYPCPRPLAGPAPFGEHAASAESYIPGGAVLPGSGRAAQPVAAALAHLVHLAPRPGQMPSLAPAPPWAAWNHSQGGLWPWPEDLDADLNQVDGPGWIDAAGQAARQKLHEDQDQAVIGHPVETVECGWLAAS